jgi:hypothetical protein
MTARSCPQCGHVIELLPNEPDATVVDNPFVPSAEPKVVVTAPRLPADEAVKPMLALSLVAPYAVLMTIVAATFAYKFYSSRFEHPLAVIPDLVGEYRNASQRRASAHSVPLPKPDQPLPAQLITALGAPIQIGQIEVTPLKIEFRAWTAYSKQKTKVEPDAVPIKDTLVLTLRIKNVSPDVLIYPMDPYFDRRPKDGDRTLPFTLIEAGGKKYFGGVISYETDRGETEREWLEGREADGRPLQPGESREVVILTRPSYAAAIRDALEAKGSEAIWRVHLRRGLYEFNGQEFSVAAVVGVRFSLDDLNRSS